MTANSLIELRIGTELRRLIGIIQAGNIELCKHIKPCNLGPLTHWRTCSPYSSLTQDNISEVVWAQEEARNSGAWTFVNVRLREILGVEVSYNHPSPPLAIHLVATPLHPSITTPHHSSPPLSTTLNPSPPLTTHAVPLHPSPPLATTQHRSPPLSTPRHPLHPSPRHPSQLLATAHHPTPRHS